MKLHNIGFILIVLSSLIACGRQSDNDANDRTVTETQKPVETEETFAELVQSKADLVECNNGRKNQLTYVKSEGQFYTCDSSNWAAVSIKGKDGKDGTSGKDGVSTANGWDDPVTGRRWIIGGLMMYPDDSNSARMNPCSGQYRLPTRSEVIGVANRGIGNVSAAISGPNSIWTSESVDAANGYYMDLSGTPTERTSIKTTARGSFCVHI